MKPDNPPAFPFVLPDGAGSPGMTLRDWFAGQALAGFLAGRVWEERTPNYENVWTEAYRLADAMLAQRGKEEK